jgi:hypothetical protein
MLVTRISKLYQAVTSSKVRSGWFFYMNETRQVLKNGQLPQMLTEYIFCVSQWWYSWRKKNDCEVCVYFNLSLSVCSHIWRSNLYIRMPGKNYGSTSFPRTSSLASATHVSPETCKSIMLLATTRIGVVDHRIEAGHLTHLSASEYGCETCHASFKMYSHLPLFFFWSDRLVIFWPLKCPHVMWNPVQCVSGLLLWGISDLVVRYRRNRMSGDIPSVCLHGVWSVHFNLTFTFLTAAMLKSYGTCLAVIN